MLGLNYGDSDSENESEVLPNAQPIKDSLAKTQGKSQASVGHVQSSSKSNSSSTYNSPRGGLAGVRLPVASTSKLQDTPPRRSTSSPPPSASRTETTLPILTEDKSTPAETEWPLAKYGIPEPRQDIAPDPTLQAKLAHFHNLTSTGLSFNATLERNKAFRNPHILSKLIQVCPHLTDEQGSNLSADWERETMLQTGAADVIGKRQKELNEAREQRQTAKDGKRSIAFEPSSTGKSSKRRDRSRSPPPRRKY